MLVFPPESTHAGLVRSFHNRDVDHYAADPAMRALALVPGEIDQSPVRDRLHKTVSQEIQGNARRADRLAIGHTLLNLRFRKSAAGANGTIVDQGASGDDLGAVSDGDIGIEKTAIQSKMSHAQFGDLTAAA